MNGPRELNKEQKIKLHNSYKNDSYKSGNPSRTQNDFHKNEEKKDSEHMMDNPLIMRPSTLYTYTSTSFTGKILTALSPYLISSPTHRGSALPSFICLLLVTCANYMLGPMRDAAALAVGVSHIPALTLASTWLALASSVPVGWLFEAPDPKRMNAVWKRFGFTRGETQGTSLALFYRVFAIFLILYAIAFKIVESPTSRIKRFFQFLSTPLGEKVRNLMTDKIGTAGYVTFYLVVHLMKLHSTSLIWGVTSEAMEYEEQAEKREGTLQMLDENNNLMSERTTEASETNKKNAHGGRSRTRLKRLAFVGFGGTMGGIIGSIIVSFSAHTLRLSGLLVIAAILLEISASLSIEIGKIMQRHWEEEQRELLIKNHLEQKEALQQLQEEESWQQHTNNLLGSEQHVSLNCIGNSNQANHEYERKEDMALSWDMPVSNMKRVASGNSMNSGHMNGLRHSESCNSINRVKRLSIASTDLIEIDASLKRTISSGSMKRIASGNSINAMRRGNNDNAMRRSESGQSINRRRKQSFSSVDGLQEQTLNAADKETIPGSITTTTSSHYESNPPNNNEQLRQDSYNNDDKVSDDNSFKQRLLRGVRTIIRSKLLLTIFTYNALYASTSVLLSFQRAQLVSNRSAASSSSSNAESDTAFLARINMASSVAVFALQASGLGAFIAHAFGQRGTLSLMPVVRFCGIILLAWWHVYGDGKPPNLILFLLLDELTRVINFAVAKPVRESLWRGLSNEARYEAKPIVDTLANRWGGGSAAFIVGCMNSFLDFMNFGEGEEGHRTIFGFPPNLILLLVISSWWTGVSAHLGYVRNKIDIELKKIK